MQHTAWRMFVIIMLGLIAGNLVVLNAKVFQDIRKSPIAASTNQVSVTPAEIAVIQETNAVCPGNCLIKIKEATASFNLVPTKAATVVRTATPQPQTSQVKEFFIPLGTGTSSSETWTNVPGAQVNIDSNQYVNIKSVTFEAAVDVPGHNEAVWVRLVNDTDNYIVSGTELYFPNGNTPVLMVSGYINLGNSNKLYKVQMKTQLGFSANLTNARIHILTN